MTPCTLFALGLGTIITVGTLAAALYDILERTEA